MQQVVQSQQWREANALEAKSLTQVRPVLAEWRQLLPQHFAGPYTRERRTASMRVQEQTEPLLRGQPAARPLPNRALIRSARTACLTDDAGAPAVVTSAMGRERSSASPRRPHRRQQRSRACTRSRQGRPAIPVRVCTDAHPRRTDRLPTEPAGTSRWSRLLWGGSAVADPQSSPRRQRRLRVCTRSRSSSRTRVVAMYNSQECILPVQHSTREPTVSVTTSGLPGRAQEDSRSKRSQSYWIPMHFFLS